MPITLKDFTPRPEDLAAVDWRAVVSSARVRECHAYATCLLRVAFAEDCREPERSSLGLLGVVASAHLNASDPTEAFGEMAITVDGRTASIDDLTEAQLDALHAWLPSLDDVELKARVGDVLWLRRRDHVSARVAVEAYTESARQLEDPEKWHATTDRLSRALRLAAQLGRNGDLYGTVLVRVEEVLAKYNGEDRLFLSTTLMELLLDVGEGDPAIYAPLAQKLAERAEATGSGDDLFRSRPRWELVRRWRLRAKDDDGAREALLRHAGTYVLEADRIVGRESPSYLLASHSLQCAINILRKVGDTRAQVEEVHRRLLDYQQRALKEFRPIGTTINIADMVEASTNALKGKTLRDAIVAFALVASSPAITELRRRVEEDLVRFPLRGLFAESFLTSAGKTTARTPPAGLRGEDRSEEAIRHRMFGNAKLYHLLTVRGAIAPCTQLLSEEHAFQQSTFLALATASAFVPPGRELTFARGLLAGVTGDFLVAGHLLVPQVEHAIRWILSERGVLVSGIDDDGIQDEYDLNRLLRSPEHFWALAETLGQDTVFDLRGLLVERTGSNLRNMVAHGLLGPEQFNTIEVVYFWWLTLRLCVLGMLSAESASRRVAED
jgi:hypothetical protein